MKRKIHKRMFGQWIVEIGNHHITITGNWLSNHGVVYSHMVRRFANGEDVQVIGMDSNTGLTESVLAYIYGWIRKESVFYANEDI